jgi:hypothetical protein
MGTKNTWYDVSKKSASNNEPVTAYAKTVMYKKHNKLFHF